MEKEMPKKTVKSSKTSKKSKVTKSPVKAPKKAVKKAKKVVPVVVPPAPPVAPAPPVMPAIPAKTEAEKIWDEIKNLPIQMFGLPNQTVGMHCTFVPVEPTKLYVTIRSSATLPSLESAVAPAFVVELADKWIIVTRASKLPVK